MIKFLASQSRDRGARTFLPYARMSVSDPKRAFQSCSLSYRSANMKSVSAATGCPLIGEAKSFCLDWRARHRTVGAIDAAVALLRLHLQTAALAFIEILAGVRGHGSVARWPHLGQVMVDCSSIMSATAEQRP